MNFKIFRSIIVTTQGLKSENTESGFDNNEEPHEEEYYAHIIDLDNVTVRDRPPFFTVEEYHKSFVSAGMILLYETQRPSTEAIFCTRFIQPIIELFIFIFKNLDEIRTAPKLLSRKDRFEMLRYRFSRYKEILLIELSGVPTRFAENDKVELERCLVDVLNNFLDDYKKCDFEVAKKLRVFGLQTEGKVLPFLLQL
ncbi:7399_t:CDS:2 [Paraglomus brasilianum]|uniref:7399_t:CDS:1 n=1 Tax=Paraglomus brasilianum TaxID=144538 RepID=A0A9N9GHC0_9GLOM|nr:7399_t:CDS:2 [Paraglomus brasilianum]